MTDKPFEMPKLGPLDHIVWWPDPKTFPWWNRTFGYQATGPALQFAAVTAKTVQQALTRPGSKGFPRTPSISTGVYERASVRCEFKDDIMTLENCEYITSIPFKVSISNTEVTSRAGVYPANYLALSLRVIQVQRDIVVWLQGDPDVDGRCISMRRADSRREFLLGAARKDVEDAAARAADPAFTKAQAEYFLADFKKKAQRGKKKAQRGQYAHDFSEAPLYGRDGTPKRNGFRSLRSYVNSANAVTLWWSGINKTSHAQVMAELQETVSYKKTLTRWIEGTQYDDFYR